MDFADCEVTHLIIEVCSIVFLLIVFMFGRKLYALFPECEALATLCGMMELNDSVDKLRLVLYPNKKQLLSANDIIILQSHLQHSNTKSLSDREYLYQCSRIVSSLPNSNFSNSMCISVGVQWVYLFQNKCFIHTIVGQ